MKRSDHQHPLKPFYAQPLTGISLIDEASGIRECEPLNAPPAWLGAVIVFAGFAVGLTAGLIIGIRWATL